MVVAMAWTSVSFPYGSGLTFTKMNQMYANFAAVAGGLSGAPKITKAAMGSGSVDFNSVIDTKRGYFTNPKIAIAEFIWCSLLIIR